MWYRAAFQHKAAGVEKVMPLGRMVGCGWRMRGCIEGVQKLLLNTEQVRLHVTKGKQGECFMPKISCQNEEGEKAS